MSENIQSAIPVILVVEDDEMVRMLAVDLFEDDGFEVIEAASGAEAIDILKVRQDVRAVLTDVHMPGSPDGLELAQHVEEVCPGCAVIIVSGRGVALLPKLGERVRYFGKLYNGREVLSAVHEILKAQPHAPTASA
jgi:CheY-like chemotaxis protein